MQFNDHHDLAGKHAFLGASNYHWVNYDKEKLITVYENHMALQRGVELHDLAKRLIEQKIKVRGNNTFSKYVNDAIGFNMTPEQVLFFSDNCFGTADAIKFSRGLLRIHDLKTGVTKADMRQLMIYAALFCLEYNQKPREVGMELRIYQSDEVSIYEPEPDEIVAITDKIVEFDKELMKLR